MGEELNVRQAFEQQTGVYEHARFGRVITAMVTPFLEDGLGSLNPEGARELAQYLVQNGSEGLVLAGTTGESPTLQWGEQMELFRAVRGGVDVPILAGTGSNSTREAILAGEQVEKEGIADALLVVSPYYNKPSQYGLFKHFEAVAANTDLPIVVYNIPGRTGGDGLSLDTLSDLAEIPNIIGLKDAAGKPGITAKLAQRVGEDFMIYSGDDGRNLELAVDASSVGAISVASHWAGNEMAAMYDALEFGDLRRATKINDMLKQSYDFESQPEMPNPHPAKAMMNFLGLEVGDTRLPMAISAYQESLLEEQAGRVKRTLELKLAGLPAVKY